MSDAMLEAGEGSHHTREPLKMKFEWVEPNLSSTETVQDLDRSDLLSPRIFPDPPPDRPASAPKSSTLSSFLQVTTPVSQSSATSSSATSSSATLNGSSTPRATAIKSAILNDARGRHIPKIYTVIADERRDDLIDKIMASPTVAGTLAKFERRKPRMTEEDVVLLVAEVGNKFRTELVKARGQASESYGMLVTRVVKEERDIWQFSKKCFESEEIDVIKPEVIALDSNFPSGMVHDWSDWSMVTAFIEVRRDWREDSTSDRKHPVGQCLNYCRKILSHSPIRSHLHFVTWCGDLVRLWYVDAAHFGCSAAYSVKDPEHRRDIGRILLLLTSEECRGSLSGRWNPGKEIASYLSDGTPLSGIWTEPLQPLYVRSGPFGSRTAIWVGSTQRSSGGNGDDGMRLFLKCSWRQRRLLNHELAMQKGIEGLPGAPSPIGRPVIPASATGFKEETAVVQEDDGRDLICDVVLYEHRLGHLVKRTVEEKSLVRLHLQFAEQVFAISKRGFHYRDLNFGNFLVQDGTDDVLVLVDYGNMRRAFGPRGNRTGTPLAEAIERARDDVRSANPCFLPHVCCKSAKANSFWETDWANLRQEEAELDLTNFSLEDKAQVADRHLSKLHEDLGEMLINSHRYVDDLESVMYLHVWQGAEKSGMSAANSKALGDRLGNGADKLLLWSSPREWDHLVTSNCSKTSILWKRLMNTLHVIISTAQTELRQELQHRFEQAIAISDLQVRLRRKLAEPNASMEGAVKSLFEGTEPYAQTEEVHPIEQRCFEDVIKELRKAVEQRR